MTINEGKERLATALLRPINPTGIIILGVFTIAWGLWVGNPFWDVFSTAPLYSFMSSLPEVVWGAAALAVGVVTTHGAINRSYGSLILGAWTGGMFWLLISLMFFLGDWMNTGGITTLVISAYAMFIYLNIRVNRRHVDNSDDLFSE